MNKIALILLFFTVFFDTKTQGQGFIKLYDIEGTTLNSSGDILISNNCILILSVSECYTGFECTGLIKADTTGFKVWDNVFENHQGILLPAKGFKILEDGSYLISGGLGYIGNPWQLFFLRVSNSGDSLKIKEYGNIADPEGTVYMSIKNDSIYSLMFYGDIQNTYTHIRLLKMDTCFVDLTELPLLGVNGYDFIYGSAITLAPDSASLYLSLKYRSNISSPFYSIVRRIDLQGNTIWEYPLNTYTTYTNAPNQIVVLPNGNIVTHWFDEGAGGANDQRNPYLLCLNPDGGFVWRHDFNDSAYRKSPIQISVAANGDIIGCGYTQNPDYLYDCGWLFRISSNGINLLENEFISNNTAINFLVGVGIGEDTQGNIFITGPIVDLSDNGIGYESNAFLLKVLPNGCFTPNCNGGAEDTLIIASTVVGVEQPPHLPSSVVAHLAVFPNPVGEVLQILLPNKRANARIQVTDVLGRTLKSVYVPSQYNQPHYALSTSDLPTGTYVVSYLAEGRLVATAKVVVQH